MKIPIRAVLPVVFLLTVCACTAGNNAAPAVYPNPLPTPTQTALPQPTASPRPASTWRKQTPAPTSMPQLLPVSTLDGVPVFEINQYTVDHTYCNVPDIFLPAAEANELTENEIAGKLMSLFLDYFNTSSAPDYCRIDGYLIDKVYYDARTPYLPLEPKGDYQRVVQFSIKLVQYPTFWATWAGDVDSKHWLHTGNVVAVFHSSSGYTMKFAHP